MKLSGNYNVGGEVAKEDERYKVVDNTVLKGLVLSSTDLNPGHSTSGHKPVSYTHLTLPTKA